MNNKEITAEAGEHLLSDGADVPGLAEVSGPGIKGRDLADRRAACLEAACAGLVETADRHGRRGIEPARCCDGDHRQHCADCLHLVRAPLDISGAWSDRAKEGERKACL
jgi:hypothetical protein